MKVQETKKINRNILKCCDLYRQTQTDSIFNHSLDKMKDNTFHIFHLLFQAMSNYMLCSFECSPNPFSCTKWDRTIACCKSVDFITCEAKLLTPRVVKSVFVVSIRSKRDITANQVNFFHKHPVLCLCSVFRRFFSFSNKYKTTRQLTTFLFDC